MCFVRISEQTAITSTTYSINWLVFTTESVYCAVRTGSLNIIQVNLGSHYAKMNITVKNKHPETHSFCNGGAAHINSSDTIQNVQNHSSTARDPTGNLQLIIHLLSAESSQAHFEQTCQWMYMSGLCQYEDLITVDAHVRPTSGS